MPLIYLRPYHTSDRSPPLPTNGQAAGAAPAPAPAPWSEGEKASANQRRFPNSHYLRRQRHCKHSIERSLPCRCRHESITAYSRRLKVGAQYCEYGAFLDYSLIVQFIHGVRDDSIRDTIVLKKPEKFTDALAIALDLEATKTAISESTKPQPTSSDGRPPSTNTAASSSSPAPRLGSLLKKYQGLFNESADKLNGPPADVKFRDGYQPVFARVRQIPFALRDQYAAEIDKKIASGCYRRVSSSQWASPTHIVKKGSKMRITGDYKGTLNPQLVVNEYPIPRVEELFHRLRGATIFSRLDITDAYMSLPCTKKFCDAMTLNTPTHGLIQPTRAQYSVASIPAIWQRRMETVLRGLNCALNFFDDILVFAKSEEEMLRALDATLSRLQEAGLKLRQEKCAFMLSSIEFLGHTVDSSGLHCQNKHIEAIKNTPIPKNANELRTFLGKNAKADILSRSPVDETCSTCPVRDDFNEFVQLQIQQTPLTSKNIARETSKDPHLSQIVQLLLNGRDLRTAGFTGREADYSLSEGCLLLGPRVVIPAKFQPQLLEELHVAHIGIVKMKALARSLVYWPSIDADIEKMAKSCQPCLKNAKLPSKFRSHHWEYPSAPWDCIHVDYCRPFLGKYILIVVDAFSKWMCAAITSNLLENWFSQFGVPSVLVSDNGPQFTSEFFKNFLKTQGVKFHKTSAVYHPSTNGQVERGVQTLKRALKDAEATPSSLQHCINNFLQYHKAPHQSAGQPPSLLFHGRLIRLRLDMI
ncbi:unnamed protein product [Nesidiocoris tenuis]|uniref:RNA-directed DNA polymerase n=1 Tax=Nesidiocoris tenuis TaxID=355587 RepID=A0A6H5GXF5_9HEMI|nr:unnamed protein product [Nesidiocoris tenuis]